MLEWSEFARRLGRELAALERDTILIVREREESRHYVQAMREPDRLYAEAVSNNFLDGPLLLTLADEEVMSESGWRPPAEPGAAGPRNWWTELPGFATPADHARLADVMVTALRDVQAVRRPSDLVYESFHRHGTGLVGLPDLGLDCADPSRITRTRASGALAGSGQPPFPEQNVLAAEPGALPPALPDAKGLSGPVPNGFPGTPVPPQNAGGPAGQGVPGGPGAPGGQGLPGGPVGGGLPGGADLPESPSIQDMLSGAAPAPGLVATPGASPADDIEPRLAEAKERGDHTTYFDLLPTADLVFPEVPGEPGPPTIGLGTGTYVTVFTSPGALARVSSKPTPFRRTSFADLSAGWPDPAWQLAINPGLASEIHLDLTAVARLGAVRPGSSTPVPPPSGGVSVPPPMGSSAAPAALPDVPSVPSVPSASYDAMPSGAGLDDQTRLDLTAVDPSGQRDLYPTPGVPGLPGAPDSFAAPGAPDSYAASGVPAPHEEFGAPGSLGAQAGNDPTATTPQMQGLPVQRDQFAAPGPADAPQANPPREEFPTPGVPAPRAPYGLPGPGDAAQPGIPDANPPHDVHSTPGLPAPQDAFNTRNPADAPLGTPAPAPHDLPGHADAAGGEVSLPGIPGPGTPFDAFATPGSGVQDGAVGSGNGGAPGGGPSLPGGPGAQAPPFAGPGLGVPDGVRGAGDAQVGPHDASTHVNGAGGELSVLGVDAPRDSFGAPGVPLQGGAPVEPAAQPDAGAHEAFGAPRPDGSGDVQGSSAHESADDSFGAGQGTYRTSGMSSLRDAFAGAAAGRRDSGAAGGLREFDTSGMPILPGLEAHGTAAMPAAAPVPDGVVAAAPTAEVTALRVPHGTAVWETDGSGDGAPVAVFDAIGSVWTPVRADALPAQRSE